MQKKDLLKEPYPINLLKSVAYEWDLDVPEDLSTDILAGVKYVLALLDERQQEIIRQRYRERKTYAEIAKSFFVTKARIYQLGHQAFVKIRKPYNWNFVQYGVWGYIYKLYKNGYINGYKDGFMLGSRAHLHKEEREGTKSTNKD